MSEQPQDQPHNGYASVGEPGEDQPADDRVATVEGVEEGGRTVFYVRHGVRHYIQGAPSEGPYDTREEAERARAQFVSAWEDSIEDS